MNCYEKSSYLLGDSDVSLNENKDYKVETKLDFVIETLQSIIAYSPLEECESLEVADKMFEIDGLLHQIRGEQLDEMSGEMIGGIGAIVAGVGSMVGLMGAKAFLHHFETDGKIVPTKVGNLIHNIVKFIKDDPERKARLSDDLKKRMPNVSPATFDKLLDLAIKKEKELEKKEKKDNKPNFKDYERLEKKYQSPKLGH